MPFEDFHPVVASWFEETFEKATDCQLQAWPAIRSGHHTLIAAPTGSGKTLAAFLGAIDQLLAEGIQRGGLDDATQVLYVSPLKALSNDIHRNLQVPLEGIRQELKREGLPNVEIRALVRTGDTPPGERAKMRQQPPHILVTTPESLFILLTSESGRAALATVRTVIVDEIHALAGNKRGTHLALSLERLAALTGTRPVRIGLSATQRPLELIANYLVGNDHEPRRLVDMGHVKRRDIALEMTSSPLQAVMPGEQWAEIYDRLAELVRQHRTTLVFVNTRRLAERAARHLAERLGEEAVTSHHGSLAREHRLDAEQRLKAGELRVLVATASLELGIDIGDVDLICQLGSPRLISTFLQRVGRSGHAVGGTPKGRLFPCTRDELVECVALLDSVWRNELEALKIATGATDVLAQQIVAETASREWPDRELYAVFRRAWPYRDLEPERFHAVVDMLANGFSTRRGRRGALVYHDAVNGKLRGRKSARLTSLTNGGTIPDQFDYDVLLEPEEQVVGTLNEDFAFESLPGDIFQLGNTSYRIEKVERSTVRVTDAKGAPPNIPFWFGEAPGRSDELSASVSRLRAEFERRWDGEKESVEPWLSDGGLDESAAAQLIEYLGTALMALKVLPTQKQIVFERFFDESGDTHLVIHSPFGSRINRAWGLALRKRFCRRFNFELQAAALEDSIVLSLSATHSFPLEEVRGYLKSENVIDVLTQAVLDAPVFATRWRWNATTALAVRRNRNGKRIAPQLQRMDAEDLIAVVFPDQLACQENLAAGEREVPDHPLVQQTLNDCLYEAMDVEGLQRVLRDIEAGRIEIFTRDLALPSPLAQEILSARPYAFLDDAPAEERRTSAVQSRGMLDPETARDLGKLDGESIEKVRAEAWPAADNADELHDALVLLGAMTDKEIAAGNWERLAESLRREGRATVIRVGDQRRWVATERLSQWRRLHPDLSCEDEIREISTTRFEVDDRAGAFRELLRSRLEGSGPVTEEALAWFLVMSPADLGGPLAALETEGFAMQGRFSGDGLEWCERRLLARINRATVDRLRRQIEPVSPAGYMRFLLEWQGLANESKPKGEAALSKVMEQLEGFAAPVAAWERDLLPVRLDDYHRGMLDRACLTGRLVWDRPPVARGEGDASRHLNRSASIRFIPRRRLACWRSNQERDTHSMSPATYKTLDTFIGHGALYFDELQDHTGLSEEEAIKSLRELAAAGRVTSDSFRGLTELLAGAEGDVVETGRWSLLRFRDVADEQGVRHVAWVLLRRYGVVFRKVLQREQTIPSWRELLGVYRRLEARGEVRGGRFVSGFSGEQFALPEAVGPLRRQRQGGQSNQVVSISAGDPLNLVGIVLPGERMAIHSRDRLVLRDGTLLAVQSDGQLRFLTDVAAEDQWRIRSALLASHSPAVTLN